MQEGPGAMVMESADVFLGTLDMLILRTVRGGAMHGWGIARRLEQMSEEVLQLNQGTLYPALVRMQHRGWIRAYWGVSDNNRRARFYALTARGRRQLEVEEANWNTMVNVLARVLTQASDQ